MRALTVMLMVALAATWVAGCNTSNKKEENLTAVPEGSAVALPPPPPTRIDVTPPPPPPPSKGDVTLPPPPPPPPAKGKTTPPKKVEKTVAGEQRYTVKAGDTLSGISKRFYGDATLWKKIVAANKDKVKDTDKITIGSVLVIPPK